MTPKLQTLLKAEAKAWATMIRGSEADARSVRGEEGKNYLAWSAAADACYEYQRDQAEGEDRRAAHDAGERRL